MRPFLQQTSSPALALYVGAVDVLIWLGALPFEFYCRTFIAHAHRPLAMTLALLIANLLLLLLIVSAAVAMSELVRRGFTRRVPVVLRSIAAARSKRSAR